jgi:segregation and condensation protein B
MPFLTSIVEALVFSSPEGITAQEMARVICESATLQLEEAEGELPQPPASTGEAQPTGPDSSRETEQETGTADDGKTTRLPPAAGQDWPLGTLAAIDEESVLQAIHLLISRYEQHGHAFSLAERASGWRVFAKGSYAVWARPLFPHKKASRLSAPALETLAIIAYRQPITKADIEAIRGVSVDGVMQNLLDRQLVCISGRSDLPGRPLLYETTEQFLDHFGIRHVEELPNRQELQKRALPTAPTPGPEEAPGETELPLLPGEPGDPPGPPPDEEPPSDT